MSTIMRQEQKITSVIKETRLVLTKEQEMMKKKQFHIRYYFCKF